MSSPPIQAHRYYYNATSADLVIARPVLERDKRAVLDEDLVLTRYMPEWKLRDFLGSQTLFFTRLIMLRSMDPDEGRVATSHYLADLKYRDSDGINAPGQREAYRQFLELGPHQQAYVSCWYKGAAESERMWLEYVPDGRGVAIQTTVQKLLAQFNGVDGGPDRIKRACLTPITYAGDDVKMAGIEERDDRVAALKYKGTKWTHENEMRAILYYDFYYVTPHLSKFGERLTVPLMEFVDRVVIAPHAPRGFEAHVRDLVAGTALQPRLYASGLPKPSAVNLAWRRIRTAADSALRAFQRFRPKN